MGKERNPLTGPPRTFLAVLLAGLVLLVVVAATDTRGYRLDLNTVSSVAVLPGQQACRGLIRPPQAGANRLRFWVAAPGGSVPRLRILIRKGRFSQVLAVADAPAGPSGVRDIGLHGSVAGSRAVAACVVNTGPVALVLTPRPGTLARTTVERLTERTDYADVALVLAGTPRQSLLAELPGVFERASLFRPGWVGEWTFWLLLAALLAGVPALLVRALRTAAETEER